MRVACGLLVLMLSISLLAGPARGDWPQFRGPTGQGLARDAQIPQRWSTTENVNWATGIAGRGWSSPVVLGDQIWLTTAVEYPPTPEQVEAQLKSSRLAAADFVRRQVAGRVSLRAVCLARGTGEIVRDIEIFDVSSPVAIHIGNSYASPSPVIEPHRVYCHFDAGTVCLDADTGKILWQREIPVFYSVGAGSSPILYENLLVLVCDAIDQQFVIALDKATGETVWKAPRPPIRAEDGQQRKAYSTPLVVRHDGLDQLIVPGAQWFISYDPRTGEEIWRVDHGPGFSNVPRPVYGNGLVYLCTGYSSRELWAVRVDGRGDVSESHVAWKQRSQIPTNPSPLLVDDLLFVISDTGVASCLDARTGETCWKERIGGNHSASPIFAAGCVYFFSQEGEATVVQASRDFVRVAENRLAEQIMASPAVLPSCLLLRTDAKLYCIQ